MATPKIRLYNPTYQPKPDPSTFFQPKQIPDLRGKRVGILDNAWWIWEQTLPTLTEALTKRYGIAKTAVYKIPRSSPVLTNELEKVIREVDCAIVGLAHGFPEIQYIVDSAVPLVKAGLPTVCVVGGEDPHFFIWNKIMRSREVNLPFVTIPKEPEVLPVEEAIKMMEAVVDDIVNALKNPPKPQAEEPAEPFIEVSDSLDEIYDIMYRQEWTDGLPVIPPTEERVRKMIAYVQRDAEEVVGEIGTLHGVATLRNIAANAIMAGCLPQYMPVLIAQVKASGLGGAMGTGMTIINGPIRKELDINCSTGLMGPGRRSNSTIGRALQLMVRNIGGASSVRFLMREHTGSPAGYTFCFGENEEESPWEPLHVERGFSGETNAVTVAGGGSIIQNATYTKDWETVLTVLANSMTYVGNGGMLYGSGREGVGRMWVFINPEHAARLAGAGLSKSDVKEYIWEKARFPVSQYPEKLKPYPHYLLVTDGRQVQVLRSPDDVNVVVVAAGPESYYAQTMAGGGMGTTVAIT